MGVALAAAALAAVSLALVWRASRQVPAFYRVALAAEPVAQRAAGQRFEREALQLHNQARREGHWEARFTEEEINGWLATDLPEKFPQALPAGASQPRVSIEPGRAQFAVRYARGEIDAVVSLAGEVYLTTEPNEVAIRIGDVRAGALPIPLAQFLDEVAERAGEAGFPLRWTEMEGDPVALVTVPLDPRDFRNRRLVLEKLELAAGELIVAGRTEGIDAAGIEVAADATSDVAEGPAQASAPSDESETRQR